MADGVDHLSLEDHETWQDLKTYLTRAKRLDADGAVRFVAIGEILAVYVAPLYPASLGDSAPTVLGLRTLRLAVPQHIDVVVSLAAMSDRFARGADETSTNREKPAGIRLPLPPDRARAAWAGISPPRSGWSMIGVGDTGLLHAEAESGVREVAEALPDQAGAQVVGSVRKAVWGAELPGVARLPRGAAFAASGLGFLTSSEPIALYAAGPWRRLTSARGHIIARMAAPD
ncbi:hypothetical protein LWF01_09835 [Saxibacter everestensis]|uniref:Uncharacterized protein n=1 Tax=Saxibacter everestensis TaxID=2909229 RepID=A0ABY8QQB7_9MICO|nr:hypothetical protein LWF01_09835 [Brevibacteriaceae bacterium ZFBP1038]